MADVLCQHFVPDAGPARHGRVDPEIPPASALPRPPPNPAFVFPMQSEPDFSPTPPTLDSMANEMSGRRSKSRSRPEHLSLPDFSFHPSSSSNENPEPDTPSSPTKGQMVPPHSGGHRRNGSEFIGGDGKNALTGLMSTSPKKGGGALPLPPGARTGPPASRRGHAHRRSGAISSHDVSTMLKPTEVRGGSAPSTPSDPLAQPTLPPFTARSISQPSINLAPQETSPVSHHRRISSTAGQIRPRVGFSDHVEFIPRPLSTISSETSSSLSTLRPCHSGTGSISSVISIGNASPPSAKSARFPAVNDMVIEGTSTFDCSTVLAEQSSPAPIASKIEAVSEPDGIPSWSDVFRSPCSEGEMDHLSSSDDALSRLRVSGTPDVPRGSRRPVSAVHSPITRPRTSPEPKVSKRQRKVKSWAGSLLARKARNSLHGVTPANYIFAAPLKPSSVAPEESSFEDLNFDEDRTCVIDTAPLHAVNASPVKVGSPLARARENSPGSDSDEPDQVLDLDAICVPNPSGPSFEEVVGGRGGAARRRMHSSGVTGGFDGPGMHYHRRAESAPELAPVNRRIFGPLGLTSSTAMADVFEEDEEDEPEDQEQDTRVLAQGSMLQVKDKQAHRLGVPFADVGDHTESPASRRQRTIAVIVSKDNPSDLRTRSAPLVTPASITDGLAAVEIVGADEEPRAATATKSSNDSALTPTLASDPFISRPGSAPMQYTLPTHIPSFATPETYSSALSTPDFSQTSFEGPRLHTAASSITDRGTLSSFRAGEQGFDLRISVDDVPSLTSSASTMASGYPALVSSSAPTRTSADRPSSLIGVVAPRTRPGNSSKRSSLASLSRLVGGSYGEKSKLNMEEHVQPEEKEKSQKKKGRGIGRLMRLWKSKEKVPSS
ncbi:MAG: hypothetical protein LQ344_000944 [Seirophora lacunosa]|nr:MAG: hypothetical protein LQ344_000944 [Seirophora lacunosa]